jgi:hypothetical protein
VPLSIVLVIAIVNCCWPCVSVLLLGPSSLALWLMSSYAQDSERAIKYLEGSALKGRIIHVEKVVYPSLSFAGVLYRAASPCLLSRPHLSALHHLTAALSVKQ